MNAMVMSGRLYTRALHLAWLIRVHSLQAALDRVLCPDRLGLPARYAVQPTRLAHLLDRIIRRSTVPFAGRCLVRSLLLFAILRPDNPELGLVLGFTTVGGEHIGHAWLTQGGVPFLEADRQVIERYPVLVELL